MNSFTRYSVVVLIVVLVCACSGKQERTEPEGYLATQISEDNRKQFVYSLEFPKLEGGGRAGEFQEEFQQEPAAKAEGLMGAAGGEGAEVVQIYSGTSTIRLKRCLNENYRKQRSAGTDTRN